MAKYSADKLRKASPGGQLQLRGSRVNIEVPPLGVGASQPSLARLVSSRPQPLPATALLLGPCAGPAPPAPHHRPASALQTTLFVGNVGEDTDDRQLQDDLSQHGRLVRCFVMRNAAGESKGYAFAGGARAGRRVAVRAACLGSFCRGARSRSCQSPPSSQPASHLSLRPLSVAPPAPLHPPHRRPLGTCRVCH
jgi:hypothetical protein